MPLAWIMIQLRLVLKWMSVFPVWEILRKKRRKMGKGSQYARIGSCFQLPVPRYSLQLHYSLSRAEMAMPRVLCRARFRLNNDLSLFTKLFPTVNTVSINKVRNAVDRLWKSWQFHSFKTVSTERCRNFCLE